MQEESQEYDEDQLESDEEIELDPEEYEQNQDPIHDLDEIEFIRDVEELARIMREYTEASGGSEEDIKECDNAGFKAEQAYNESREIEQNQEEKEAYQEVEEKERELTKEENLEQTREDLSIQEQQEDFEEIEEEFAEIEQDEFEYLREKYEEYEQEGRNAEEIAELMHEAEEAYEVLKQAEEAYNQQEKENLKSINQEEEEDLEEYKKEIETEEVLKYLVEAEEKLYAEGKSSQEIAKEMQKVENVYEIKEEVEKVYEQQEKDKLKLVDHEEEEDLEDERDEIDRRDAIEFLIETEEELLQREKSQEKIDEQMEKITNDYFQNEQEKNQQIEQEKEIIKEIKNVPKEIDEKNSEIEEQKKVEQALTHYDERAIEVNLDAEEEVLEEIESDLEDNVKSDSPQERINESLKESEVEESEEGEHEKLQDLYHQETGRNSMYAGKETKGFRQWLVERELKNKEKDEKWKKTLKKWIEESREEEINSELKQILKEILQNFSKYEEFEELLRRYKNAKLTEKEREKLSVIIIKILNKNPIHLQLYYNLSGFKAYYQKQHWWNPWLIKEIKYKFLNHLLKKYEKLKQNLRILFELSKQNTWNDNSKENVKSVGLSCVNNNTQSENIIWLGKGKYSNKIFDEEIWCGGSRVKEENKFISKFRPSEKDNLAAKLVKTILYQVYKNKEALEAKREELKQYGFKFYKKSGTFRSSSKRADSEDISLPNLGHFLGGVSSETVRKWLIALNKEGFELRKGGWGDIIFRKIRSMTLMMFKGEGPGIIEGRKMIQLAIDNYMNTYYTEMSYIERILYLLDDCAIWEGLGVRQSHSEATVSTKLSGRDYLQSLKYSSERQDHIQKGEKLMQYEKYSKYFQLTTNLLLLDENSFKWKSLDNFKRFREGALDIVFQEMARRGIFSDEHEDLLKGFRRQYDALVQTLYALTLTRFKQFEDDPIGLEQFKHRENPNGLYTLTELFEQHTERVFQTFLTGRSMESIRSIIAKNQYYAQEECDIADEKLEEFREFTRKHHPFYIGMISHPVLELFLCNVLLDRDIDSKHEDEFNLPISKHRIDLFIDLNSINLKSKFLKIVKSQYHELFSRSSSLFIDFTIPSKSLIDDTLKKVSKYLQSEKRVLLVLFYSYRYSRDIFNSVNEKLDSYSADNKENAFFIDLMDFANNYLKLTEQEIKNLEELNNLISRAFWKGSALAELERRSDEALNKLKNMDLYR